MPTPTHTPNHAQLAEHLAVIDRHLPAGAHVTLTPEGVEQVRAAIAGALSASALDLTDHLVPGPAEPEVDIAPDLLRDMKRIKQLFRGLAYDPHDRPEEVAAVIAAARSVGLVPVPDESLFRSYRGCTPPEPAPALVVDPAIAALAAEAEQYRWTPGTAGPVDEVLAILATQARPLLEALHAAGANGGQK